jgi:hypothetical protein
MHCNITLLEHPNCVPQMAPKDGIGQAGQKLCPVAHPKWVFDLAHPSKLSSALRVSSVQVGQVGIAGAPDMSRGRRHVGYLDAGTTCQRPNPSPRHIASPLAGSLSHPLRSSDRCNIKIYHRLLDVTKTWTNLVHLILATYRIHVANEFCFLAS